MITDPVGDMATRIRNALAVEAIFVDIPYSRLKAQVAFALQREGFIWDFDKIPLSDGAFSALRMNLKYGPSGERVLSSIKRVSKPGRRVYYGADDTPKVRSGLGVTLMSTNQGVLSSRESTSRRIGGEALLEVW